MQDLSRLSETGDLFAFIALTLSYSVTGILGHKLKMKVVAEGVENRQVWSMLKKIGCDIVQGYYIAKPMFVDDFERWRDIRFSN